MKYISFLLILGWSIWILNTNPDITFSDNWALCTLGALSAIYSLINFIILTSEIVKNKKL
jgi:hypothetical protein